jgi:ACS family hexuronate transporter-like MFS transporter
MYLGAGLLIDRYGTKLVYGVAAAWWSVAAMLRATASSVLGFGVFRFLLGTAESSNFIAAEKVAAEWYPPRDRGTLNGWVQAGAVTGAIVTPILVMTLTERFGMSLIAKPSVPLTIAILCVVLFGHMSWKTNLATLTVDLFPRRIVASVHGLVATGSGIGGALFTAVAGHLIDWKGYTPVFVIMGVLHPIAYLCVRWLVREKAG